MNEVGPENHHQNHSTQPGVRGDPSGQQDAWSRRVRNYYQDQALPTARVRAMLADAPARGLNAGGVWRTLATAAAGLVLGLGIVFGYGEFQQHRLHARIAQEIAGNHVKRMPAEFDSDDWQELAARLERLEFNLVDARDQLPANFALLGARYCTLQGRLAAQLQLRHASRGDQTLYVAPAGEELLKIPADAIVRSVSLPVKASGEFGAAGASGANLVRVRIWRAGGLVFGLAADLDP
ncbi:MAG: hypothetical protein NXI24_15985 [bacterium]|nr:hypothetical protein [bacterium]